MKVPTFKWTSQPHDRFFHVFSPLLIPTSEKPGTKGISRLNGASSMANDPSVSANATQEENGHEDELDDHDDDCDDDHNDDDDDDNDELVQRQLQLRIEAQRNYLQSALERAREMLERECRSSESGSCLTCNDDEIRNTGRT